MSLYAQVVLNVPVNGSFTYLLGEYAETAKSGMRAEVAFGNRRMTAFITALADAAPEHVPHEKIKPIIRLIDKEPLFSDEHIQISLWIRSYYLCTQGEALSAMLPAARREACAEELSPAPEKKPASYELSEEQERAVRDILQTETRQKQIHYLYGPTGSGKTEVFLKVAENMLADGKGIIYLVPEISLTKQITDAVVSRFGATAAVLHSGLTASQRLGEWKRIQDGRARIVIGARSAVFAPVPNLGAIIIDEEHDGAYKSDATPRYHARQIAMFRCGRLGIPLIMGSATPSAEAWALMQEGTILRHTLSKRLSGGAPPQIIPVNMSEEKQRGNSISQILRSEIEQALCEKRQIILFLNRRGFTHFFRCSTCGYEMLCKNCSVALTYHKNENKLRCHYCGWSLPPPQICPECGSLDVGYSGFGTEFTEKEIRMLYPHASVDRIDTDNLKRRGELQEKLDAFKSGKTDILLGTQMIAKGLNFPNLKLVGIIMADTGLYLPDFRSSERTFALITQVAGRAGRYFPDGKVIVQSCSPEREAIICACRGDTEQFYRQELEQRKILGFPPYARLIRLVFRSAEEQTAWSAACGAADILQHEAEKKHIQQHIEILGPSECPISRIAANYRMQIILRGSDIGKLQSVCRQFLFGYRSPHGVYIEADTDPVHML